MLKPDQIGVAGQRDQQHGLNRVDARGIHNGCAKTNIAAECVGVNRARRNLDGQTEKQYPDG